MQQDPSASSLASKTWIKWNRTLVNRWKKNKWPCIRLPMSGCWFGRTRPCSTRTRRCFLLHLRHVPHPGTVWPRWTGPELSPFPLWTPSWIKIASRLCHMYDLWQVVRTKPQVLKYSIHLYLGLIWLFFLVLTKGYSLFLLTAKFLACLYLYSEQVIRVVRRYNTIGKWMHCFVETVNDNHGPVNTNKLNQ